MYELESNRLGFRQFNQEDLDDYYHMVSDKEVMRYLGDGKVLNKMDCWIQMASMLGHWQLRGYGMWAIVEKSTNKFVGRVGLFNPEGWPGIEVCWAINRDSWGKGFATEAALETVRWALDQKKYTKLISLIKPENIASIKVAEKIGHVYERTITVKEQKALLYSILLPQA